jgi:ribosomal protein L32E
MVKSTPLLAKKIVKKRTAKFVRFESDCYPGRMTGSWRRPRGTTVSYRRY